ncbi:MAG: endonuclease/exonuclease/phosphatase family protein, partial [Myxococcales bacterium]|nr:endonuclease/exonuclease/phosphatase family protein [Myxococcales bacterium]
LNIWNRQGPYAERETRLRRGLADLAADVVGLQEVVADRATGRSQADELGEDLYPHRVFGMARPIDEHRAYGNALLSRFPVADHQVVALPCLGVDEPRSVLVARLETPAGILPVLVTHYSYRLDHGFVREQQSLAIARLLDGVGGDLPPLLLGDLNAAPDTTEIRFLRGAHALEGRSVYLADSFGLVGEGPGYTFDGRHNGFAAPWREPPRRIDYIFAGPPDAKGRLEPLESEVVLTKADEGIHASDHFGVLTRFQL